MTNSTSQLIGLAIHTASTELGLALGAINGASRYQVWDLGRSLSTHLHFHLSEFIQPHVWTDLAFLAVVQGPGGFTGTRIGMVAARTLAQQLELPLYAVSTLAAIAWSVYFDSISYPWVVAEHAQVQRESVHIAVQMPAQRGEYHVAIYALASDQSELQSISSSQLSRPALTALLTDRVLPAEQWQQILAQWHQPYCLVQVTGGLGASAVAVLEMAQQQWQQGIYPSWETALPFYGQSPV